jgi:2-polyprenyl-6-methoxyphenol hydroxylase-like FAD-dependent oxidoreductase
MTEHAVVVVGAGPTGLMVAGELALAGIDVAIVERRAGQQLEGTRSRGLHARTIEVLEQRGIADRFLAEGRAMQIQSYARVPLDISDFPARHNYGLALLQKDFERILAAWVDELGVCIRRKIEVRGFTQGESGVDVELDDGALVSAQYLVGCDGGRSLIRKAAGIDFQGWDASICSLIAEVELSKEPEWGIRYDDTGTQAIGKLDGHRAGVVITQPYAGQTGEATMDDLSRGPVEVWGTDYGAHSPSWISRFTDATRQAASYRAGHVLLAGDAAHVHYPIGGQGLNLGVQDAVNLGWKLAQVIEGTSPPALLDSYQAERHPVAARVLQNTMAQTALARSDPRIDALRANIAELLSMEEPRHRFAAMVSGLDIHYDLGDGHPLLGRRMPDLDIVTDDGPARVSQLLHTAQGVFLNFGNLRHLETSRWSDRVVTVDARYQGPWELPALGEVEAPSAVLIRPDGYVAWVGEGTDQGLSASLATWFGESELAA